MQIFITDAVLYIKIELSQMTESIIKYLKRLQATNAIILNHVLRG